MSIMSPTTWPDSWKGWPRIDHELSNMIGRRNRPRMENRVNGRSLHASIHKADARRIRRRARAPDFTRHDAGRRRRRGLAHLGARRSARAAAWGHRELDALDPQHRGPGAG